MSYKPWKIKLNTNGSFPPTEMDSGSDSDSKPYRYIVLCTTSSTSSDSDSDPCTDIFPNGYCTHFRDGSPSQRSGSESVFVGGNEPLWLIQTETMWDRGRDQIGSLYIMLNTSHCNLCGNLKGSCTLALYQS